MWLRNILREPCSLDYNNIIVHCADVYVSPEELKQYEVITTLGSDSEIKSGSEVGTYVMF